MKIKTSATIGVLLLLSIAFASAPQLFGEIKTVKALNAGIAYAPNYHIDYLDLAGEEQLTRDVCNYIMNQFSSYGYNYGWLYNCQDSSATRSAYGSNAYSAEVNYDKVAIFTKGHAANYKCTPSGPMHHYLMDHNGLHVEDDYIWSNTPYGKHRFVCIWHCGTMMDYPGTTCPYCGGHTSMPYAWTHDNSLNLEAYTSTTGNYVFIGHEGWSPQFLNNDGCIGSYNYGDYVRHMYNYLLQSHMSIHDAASWASYDILANFYLPGTILYQAHTIDPPDPPPPLPPFPAMTSRMHIYGNGSLGVPGY